MNSLKIIRNNIGAKYSFNFLEWDTNFFGLPCYKLDVQESVVLPDEHLHSKMIDELGGAFVTAKIPSNTGKHTLCCLQKNNFRYIETEITLRHSKKVANVHQPSQLEVKRIESSIELPFQQLGSVFSLTRFHTDYHIPPDKADTLWVQYLRNFIPGPQKLLYVARHQQKILGVILVNIDPTTQNASLFFVAVLPEAQRGQIGSMLIQRVVDELPDRTLLVGTQAKNISALNFYLKNGFCQIDSTSTVLHWWGPKSGIKKGD